MEVGNQSIDHTKAVARLYKNIRFALPGLKQTLLINGRFQGACYRRPQSNDAATFGSCFVYKSRCRLRDLINFRVHTMIKKVFSANRQESARADMQRHPTSLNTFCSQGSESLFSEMQSGCRRSDSSGVRIDQRMAAKRRTKKPPLARTMWCSGSNQAT